MSKIHHVDVKYSKSYATYERAAETGEAMIEKLGLKSTTVVIVACGEKHDRFAPVFRLGQDEQFNMGALAHSGFNVI